MCDIQVLDTKYARQFHTEKMNTTYFENKVSHWTHRWSESNSPYSVEIYDGIYIQEPINTITSLCMMFYVVWDIIKLHPHSCCRPVSKVLRLGILGNLWTSAIAHATYHYYIILLDEYSIIAVIIFYITYKDQEIPKRLIIVFLYSDTFGYVFATIECLSLLLNDVNKLSRKRQVECYYAIRQALLCFGCWLMDQWFPSYWFFYGHAIFHIGFTYNVVKIINILYTD